MKFLGNKTRIFLNSLVVISATIGEKFLFFLVTIIIARYLSIELYGEYATALGYATFFAGFTNLGINQMLVRQINLFPDKEKIHFANSLVLKLLITALAFIVMLFTIPFTGYNKNIIILIIILAFVRFGTEMQSVFYTYYEAKERFLTSSFFIIVFSVSVLIVTIVAIMLKGDYYTIVIFRLCLVILFLFALFIFSSKYYGVVSVKTGHFLKFILESIPFGIATILQANVIGNINIIIVSIILGAVSGGFFNNALLFFKVFFLVPYSISKVILPFLYKQIFSEENEKYQFSFNFLNKVLGIFSFYILLVFYLFSEKILTLVFGVKYIGAVQILKIIIIALPFAFNVGTIIITALNKQTVNTWIYFIASVINIISCIVFTKIFGLEGAAWSVVITFFVIFLSSIIYIKIRCLIKILDTFFVYSKLGIIIMLLYLLHKFVFTIQMNWFIEIIIVSIIYIFLVIIGLIRRDDIRIIKETLNLSIDPTP